MMWSSQQIRGVTMCAGFAFTLLTGACSRSHESKVQDARNNVHKQEKELAEERHDEAQDVAKEQQDANHDIAQKQEDLNRAQHQLSEAERGGTTEWQKDWSDFRDAVDKKVADNDKLITEKRNGLANASTDMHAEYKKILDDAEHRNHDFRDHVADYKFESKDAWDRFKHDVDQGLDAVASSIKGIDIKK